MGWASQTLPATRRIMSSEGFSFCRFSRRMSGKTFAISGKGGKYEKTDDERRGFGVDGASVAKQLGSGRHCDARKRRQHGAVAEIPRHLTIRSGSQRRRGSGEGTEKSGAATVPRPDAAEQ